MKLSDYPVAIAQQQRLLLQAEQHTHGSLIFREGRQIEDPGKYRSPAASPLTVKFFAVGD
jgi:hypothetical protein